MSDFMQRHFPDILHHTLDHDHAILIGLDNSHIAAREIGQQYTESNRNQQQRLILLLDTQVEQDECNGIHDQKTRVSNNVAESRHFIQSFNYIFHYKIFINTSSSETLSPEFTQIAVMVPLNSARIAL